MNSDTPRTDEAESEFQKVHGISGFGLAKVSRHLEIELREAMNLLSSFSDDCAMMDSLRQKLKEATEFAVCAYCQTKLLKNPLHILEHMEVCEKHPFRRLNEKIVELELRLADSNRKLRALPGDWLSDSSLETWFPMTAEELKKVKAERDALKIEYEIRRDWIRKMNDILGYNNDDGFHSEPEPFEIARRLKAFYDAHTS